MFVVFVAVDVESRVAQGVELRAGVRVDPGGVGERRIGQRRRGQPVGLGQRGDGLGEVADQLVLVVLRVELAGLGDRGAVVVGGVVLRDRAPAPRRAAVQHVEALAGGADRDVLLVEDVRELVVDQLRALLVARAAPRVEGAALELGGDQRLAGDVVVADVRDAVPARRVGAVEALRVGVGGVDVEGGFTGVEGAVVVAHQGNGDAVGAGLVLEVLHVGAAVGVAVVVLVLDLVGEHAAGAVGELVARDDPVDLRLPLVGVLQVDGIGAARVAGGGGQPGREAAAVDLGVDVRPGPRDDVEPGLLRPCRGACRGRGRR